MQDKQTDAETDTTGVAMDAQGSQGSPNFGGATNVLSVKLQCGRADCDEEAEVRVAVQNPAMVLDRMLHSISSKFPPESVVTMNPGGVVDSQFSSATGSIVTTGSRVETKHQQKQQEYHYGHHQYQQYPHSERLVSSTVLSEVLEGEMPHGDEVRYVEVPVIEEVIRHVPKKQYVEIEKRVPKYEVQYVEKIVNIPQIQYIDKQVEVEQIQDVVRHVPKKEIVDVPREVITHVTKIIDQVVQREVEVPGPIVEVPKPYVVENQLHIPQYHDTELPTVVAQSLNSIIREVPESFQVDAHRYEPRMVAVDVFLPLPVRLPVSSAQKISELHRTVNVKAAHFNSLLYACNTQLQEEEISAMVFRPDPMAPAPMLPVDERIEIVAPISNDWQRNYVPGSLCVEV